MLPCLLLSVFHEAEARSISWRRPAACWEICKAKTAVKRVLRQIAESVLINVTKMLKHEFRHNKLKGLVKEHKL